MVKASTARILHSRPLAAPTLDPSRLLGQSLFRDAMTRERRRADRFGQVFVLILISLGHTARRSRWDHVIRVMSQTTFGGDVLGWYEDGSIIGLIRTFGESDSEKSAAAFADTVHRKLTWGSRAAAVETSAIQAEIYSPKGGATPRLLLESDIRRQRTQSARDLGKRMLDIGGSLACLVAFSPVFALVSALVKITSKGPVFFCQQRIGYAGQPFTMFKFRTMVVNADPAIHQKYLERFIHSEHSSAATGQVFKLVDDPRVTALGRFLRKSSLDEFPQFWNVLRGDMSLVGPRPPLAYEVAQYKPWHKRRVLDAKPGITGLWQVTGRSRTTFDEMVRLDLRYAMTYSVWTDLKILFATPRAVLSGRGAH